MKRLPLIALSILLAHPLIASAQHVKNTSFLGPDGSRVLQHQVVVDAPLAEAWKALTTTEGLTSWAVPVGKADFRLNGIWEASYNPQSKIGDPRNIRNRYLAYLPMKMIAIQIASAPPGFPHPELTPNIFTVIEFEPVGPGETKLTASMVGFGQGEGYDAIYKHFEWGNDWTFEKLYKRFKDGPVDWAKELAPKK